MNVYDFDGTIYNGDSSIDFYLYVLRHKPSVLRYVPKQVLGFFLYGIKKIDKTRMKEYYFSFLKGIDTVAMTTSFWNENRNKIFSWYLAQKKDDDIIISASPEFLLSPICKNIQVGRLIASKVDLSTGKFYSINCRGEEKVRRLREETGIMYIDNFYSDSQSDLPLAKIANKTFLVNKGKISEWKFSEKDI